MWNKLRLYFHTLRYLRFSQLSYQVYYRFRKKLHRWRGYQYPVFLPLTPSQPIVLLPSLDHPVRYEPTKQQFTFLSQSVIFPDKIDWNYTSHGKLWTYNLNYFEFLHQPEIDQKTGLSLIQDYIAQRPQLKDGLEPYPTSLRIIYWIKFLRKHNIQENKIDQCLRADLFRLQDNLEYHLRGNHLLENAFALLFGAYYFRDALIYKKATSLLQRELEEQVLEDGAHYELSPMYHQLMLYRVLDAYNIVKSNSFFTQDLLEVLKKKAALMLGWLQQMTFANGSIPLLNDAAFGINPTTGQLVHYAEQLGIRPTNSPLSASGYRRINGPHYECIVDVGQIGPDYIPGHAHGDIFNFVLQVKGHPVLVDTGTSTYEATERRIEERSTAAHNTVSIGDFEQAEIWSSFRVARRSAPNLRLDEVAEISAVLDYPTVRARHERKFHFEEQLILIRDRVESAEQVCAHLHFHPTIQPSLVGNTLQTDRVQIHLKGASKIEIQPYEYAPEFNLRQAAQEALIYFDKILETRISIS